MTIRKVLTDFFADFFAGGKQSRADGRIEEESPTGVREKKVTETFHDTITQNAAAENTKVEVEIWGEGAAHQAVVENAAEENKGVDVNVWKND